MVDGSNFHYFYSSFILLSPPFSSSSFSEYKGGGIIYIYIYIYIYTYG